jgi:quercetin dioxygenase-like cupin family protein
MMDMESTNGIPIHLATELNYNEEKFANKLLFNNGVFRLTAFAFRQHQSIPEHSTPTEAYLQIITGEAMVVINGHEHHVKAGELIVLPKDLPHSVQALSDCKALLIK